MSVQLVEVDVVGLANKAKATYNYYKGRTTHTLSDLKRVDKNEVKEKSKLLYDICQEFDKTRTKYTVSASDGNQKLLMTFDATKVPISLSDEFKPNGKYYDLINSYNEDTKQVELIVGYDKGVSESVMNPTPTPYEYEPVKLPKCLKLDCRDDDLEEDLEMTPPEPYHNEKDDELYLRVNINGIDYDYKMKDESSYSIDQMYDKIIKMMNYSKGKALAFLKKNMIGRKRVSESVVNDLSELDLDDLKTLFDYQQSVYNKFKKDYETHKNDGNNDVLSREDKMLIAKAEMDKVKNEIDSRLSQSNESLILELNTDDEDIDEIIKSTIREVNKEIEDYDSKEYITKIEDKLKDQGISVDADLLGQSIADVMNESNKVSFKDVHICQGCGNPLSKCTCEVEDEETVNESLEDDTYEEDFSSGSATQSSSVGSHKRFSIDMIPNDECKIVESEEEEERSHPYVGKRAQVRLRDTGSLYGSVVTVTRAYDTPDGVVVRSDLENGSTITMKPGEYKIVK